MTEAERDRVAERALERDRALIGGRETVEIVIAEYDPAWPERFAVLARQIAEAVGGGAVSVEHIGSTSVPGLPAKPILDILLVVRDVEQEADYLPQLEGAGFVLRVREDGHRMVRTPARDVHVHIYAEGRVEVDDYRAFRDQLRRSDADRELYAFTKRQLAARDFSDMNDYSDAKTEVVSQILDRARARTRT